MKRISLIILTVVSLTYCSAQDRTLTKLEDNELHQLEEYLGINSPHTVQIADDKEPGTRLIVCGTLVKKENGNPIPNQHILLYHTDNKGDYQPQIVDDVTSARLNGTVTTDKNGRFTVKTILPGDYIENPDTKHIHTIVTGAKPKSYEFYFKQYIIGYLKDIVESQDESFLIDLKKTDNGTLIGFITLEVKGYE